MVTKFRNTSCIVDANIVCYQGGHLREGHPRKHEDDLRLDERKVVVMMLSRG